MLYTVFHRIIHPGVMNTIKKYIERFLNRSRGLLVNYFTSGLTDTHNVELIRKVNMLNAIGTISISALVPLGADALRLGSTAVGFADFSVAAILIMGIIYLRKGQNFRFIINISIFSAGCLFLILMVLKWEGGAGYLWYFVFPLISSFLLGSRKGFFASLILIFITILLFIFSGTLHFSFEKSWGYRIRFLAAYGVVSILAYSFEKTREKTQTIVEFKNKQLGTHVGELEQLRKELQDSNRNLESKIKERTKDLVETNIQLDRQIKEKEILLKEVHHRVKNNLQIISSLLYLQSQKIEDKKTESYFLDSRNRVLSMAMVHENLYQSDNLAQINLKAYIESLTSELLSAYNTGNYPITLKLNIENVPLTIEKAIPLGLIINELVSNSIKYAFNEAKKGTISIKLERLDTAKASILIADNGEGMGAPPNLENMETLGLTLVRSLVDQIDGTATVFTETGTGFKIVFEI